MIAAQLERIPSPMRKMFELRANMVLNPEAAAAEKRKSPLSPDGEVPKYWNNKPKTDPNQAAQFFNAYHEMSAMKSEQKKHQAKVKEEQKALLSASEGEPEEAWYKDESAEMQAQVKYSSFLSAEVQQFMRIYCSCNNGWRIVRDDPAT